MSCYATNCDCSRCGGTTRRPSAVDHVDDEAQFARALRSKNREAGDRRLRETDAYNLDRPFADRTPVFESVAARAELGALLDAPKLQLKIKEEKPVDPKDTPYEIEIRRKLAESKNHPQVIIENHPQVIIEPGPGRAALPEASAERKAIPLARGLLDYFPAALAAVAQLSRAGNDKHNPGQELHHARGKSSDHADCILRHLVDRGTIDAEDGILHDVKVAWRALAQLQEELERRGAPLARGARLPVAAAQPEGGK